MPFAATPYDHDHEQEVTLFAETNFRNQRRKFGIKTDDRRRHMYIVGKTGMGKTTLLENMVLADIYAGHGLAYVDPHGDTAAGLLDFIPPHRINDVVYFNPGDMEFPIGFNILETIDPSKKHLVAAGLMGVFKKIWPDVWSARMEYILLNAILALLDAPGSTLLGINRLLVDPDYRKRVVSLIQDPVVKTFWVKEFAAFSEKYRTEAIAPIQNKVGQFLSASIIRNIVAQVKSTIDVREIMDSRKILILNLAKGLIGEENSRLLGGMLVTRLQLAAMERVDMPEKARQDFYLYVDEFQNFATESFANILSEARKYRLNLIVAHQYIEQLEEEVRDAIFGNVGTIVSFRVGAADASFMETEFSPRFMPEDLVNLGKYDVYLKLMIDGASSQPFSATTLAPIAQRTGSSEKVIKVSRERNARPRLEIEEKVIRWSGMGTADAGAVIDLTDDGDDAQIAEKIKELAKSSPDVGEMAAPSDGGFAAKKKKPPVAEIACSVCGKIQQLSFEPDRSRPWYCKEDLEKRNLEMEKKKLGGGPSAPPSAGPSAPRPPRVDAPPAAVNRPRVVEAKPRPPQPPSQPPAPPKLQPAPKPPAPPAPARDQKPPQPDLRQAKPVVKLTEEKPVSLSSILGRPLNDSDEMEVIVEEDDDEDDDGGEGESGRGEEAKTPEQPPKMPPPQQPKTQPKPPRPPQSRPQKPPHMQQPPKREPPKAPSQPPPKAGPPPAEKPPAPPKPTEPPKPDPAAPGGSLKPGQVIKF